MSIENGKMEYRVTVYCNDRDNIISEFVQLESAVTLFNCYLNYFINPHYSLWSVKKTELVEISTGRILLTTDYYNRIK